MRSLDDITRDLAQVTDDLLALSAEDYARRYELLTRQDELREEASEYHIDLDAQRPVVDIRAELAETTKQRNAEAARLAGRNMMSGPGGTGMSAGAVSAAMVESVLKANANSPIVSLNARIALLEAALAAKGLDPYPAPGPAAPPVAAPDPSEP
jgi:hypothetical protein